MLGGDEAKQKVVNKTMYEQRHRTTDIEYKCKKTVV